jgi:competence protein ComEC
MIICALLSSASLRFHLATEVFDENHISRLETRKIKQFRGLVIDYQHKKNNRNKYIISVETLSFADSQYTASGKIILYTKKLNQKFYYGDRLQVDGALIVPSGIRNPGQFDYRDYLYNQNIYHMAQIDKADSIILLDQDQGNWFVQFIISPLRSYCQNTFSAYFDEQTSGLIMALILGEKQGLDKQMIDDFKKVGVVHVLAISGLHVGFIITFVFSLLSLLRLNQKSKIWSLLIILVIYIILVRFKTPVIRASSMAILYLLGQGLERKVSIYNIIFAAMTIILLFDPRELFNPGFHFSFLAVLSIIYGYDKLDRLIPVNSYLESYTNKYPWIAHAKMFIWLPFLVSASAVVGTFPLTLYYYGLLPTYALLANLIVIPLTGILVFLSLFLLFLAGLSDLFALGLGRMIAVVNMILQRVVEFVSDLPNASIITPTPTFIQILLLYTIILIALDLRKNLKKASLLLVVLLLLLILTFRPESLKSMQVAFLDVGQGDAAFIRFPNQRTMLIDAGNRFPMWDEGEKTVLPYLQSINALQLNYLVGSHAHNDHIGGFRFLLETISVDTIVLNAYRYNSKYFSNLLSVISERNIPLKIVGKGDKLIPDPLCRVYFLHPDSLHLKSETYSGAECNNSSVVMKVTYGENSILFTGDLEESGEQPLLLYEDFLESEILKVGHHGSGTSTSTELLNSVKPVVAIISVAKKNKFKHPSPKTLDKLNRFGIKTYQTSNEGAIIFEIGPERISKVAWR